LSSTAACSISLPFLFLRGVPSKPLCIGAKIFVALYIGAIFYLHNGLYRRFFRFVSIMLHFDTEINKFSFTVFPISLTELRWRNELHRRHFSFLQSVSARQTARALFFCLWRRCFSYSLHSRNYYAFWYNNKL